MCANLTYKFDTLSLSLIFTENFLSVINIVNIITIEQIIYSKNRATFLFHPDSYSVDRN